MALETGDYISDLNENNPTNQDPKSQGAAHFRLIKKVLRQSFTGITGAVSATQTQLNRLASLTGLSVLGRSASTAGETAAITAASDHQVLRRSGTAIGFGAINLASSNAVTGTLPSANVSGSYTGITGTGALNAGSITSGFGNINIGTSNVTAGSFSGSGASLTSLNASNVTTGTLNSARLPGVALRNVTSGQTSGSVTVSTGNPSGGSNGDIWLKREA